MMYLLQDLFPDCTLVLIICHILVYQPEVEHAPMHIHSITLYSIMHLGSIGS